MILLTQVTARGAIQSQAGVCYMALYNIKVLPQFSVCKGIPTQDGGVVSN